MASGTTHFTVGAAGSAAAASVMFVAGIATPVQVLAWAALGALGSLLPDLDAADSTPTRVTVFVASLVAAFAVMFELAPRLGSVLEMAAVWLAVYLLCRGLAYGLLARIVTHRGVFHSLPAAALAGLLAAIAAQRLLQRPATECWLAGGFVAFGYALHLLVDELSSADLLGMRTRRSFGTAMRLWSARSPIRITLLYAGCAGALAVAPAADSLAPLILGARMPVWLPVGGLSLLP